MKFNINKFNKIGGFILGVVIIQTSDATYYDDFRWSREDRKEHIKQANLLEEIKKMKKSFTLKQKLIYHFLEEYSKTMDIDRKKKMNTEFLEKLPLDLRDFSDIILADLDLSDLQMPDAYFDRTKFIRVKFNRANLQNSRFREAKIEEGVDFSEANLEGVVGSLTDHSSINNIK